MNTKLCLTILSFLILNSALSQSGKCFQTVQFPCGDSIVDYLTKSEKRNLVVMYYRHQQLKAENEYLRESVCIDSAYIVKLKGGVSEYKGMLEQMQDANRIKDDALNQSIQQVGLLRKQIKREKLKTGLLYGGTGAALLTILVGSIIIFK